MIHHNSPYRIVFYCSSASWGGLEMNVIRFAKWMKDRGHDVTCCFVKSSPLYSAASQNGISPIEIKRNFKYFDLINAYRISKLFQKLKAEVVWFRDNRDLSVLGWAKSFSSLKFRLLYQQAMQLGVDKKDFVHTWRFRNIDAWISPLEFLADQVKTRTHFRHDKIHVIPLALELDKFTHSISRTDARHLLNIPQGKTCMGVIGRLDPLKGQHIAIEALAKITKEFPELHLVIAGESTRNEGNDYELQLKQLVSKHRLDGVIHFLPFRKDVENLYRALDIFVLPSSGETFGMVTIEAMASGCVVIGTNASGTPEILENGHCGLLFEPGDADSLANQITSILKDEMLEEKIIANAAQSIGQYDYQTVCSKIENAISNL